MVRTAAMAAVLLGAAVAGEPSLTEAQLRSFRWFQSLDYPDLAELPFVTVRLVEESPEDGDPFREHGFLLCEHEDTFEVFTVGLRTQRFAREGTPRRPGARFERIALEDYVRAGLHHLADPPPDDRWWAREPFGHRRYMPNLWFRAYVLGFACERRGHLELASALLRLPEGDERFLRGCGGDVLRGLKDQVAEEALRNLTLEFGDPDIDWTELLARCRWWKEKFTAARGSEWLDAAIPAIQEIVEPTAPEAADPVARLIRRLTDAGPPYSRQPGDGGGGAELVRIGVGAVPQLLDAWDDPRPSRSIASGFTMKAYLRESVAVVPVREHVRAIVAEIAGRKFETKAEVALWHEEVSRDGEEAVLVRAVQSGGNHAARSAAVLLERYPAAAEAAILAGLAKASNEGLVWNLRTLRTDATTRFLLDEIRAGEARRRVVAAWLLLSRGDRSGIPAVLEAWCNGSRDRDVVVFLAGCGAPEGIAALQEEFGRLPAPERAGTLSILHGGRGYSTIREGDLPTPDPGWAPATERLLVHALADEATSRFGPTLGKHRFHFPRICDLSACVLAERFPDRYAYDPDASIGRRDRRILEMRNVWLEGNGLPTLPVPAALAIEPLPKDAAAALWDAFVKDRDPAPIERLGLAAFPAACSWLAAMPADDPARAPLEDVRRRLGCLVASLDAPADPEGTLAALKGRPLTVEALVAALDALGAHGGFSLWASRDDDGTGIALRLRLGRGGDGVAEVTLRAAGRWLYHSSGERWMGFERRLGEVLDGDPSVAFELSVRFEG